MQRTTKKTRTHTKPKNAKKFEKNTTTPKIYKQIIKNAKKHEQIAKKISEDHEQKTEKPRKTLKT